MSNSVSATGRNGRGSSARGKSGLREGGGLYTTDGRRKYLNRAERDRAMAAMAELEQDRELFALTLAWTGARISEVLALTPASFQIEDAVVSFVTLKRRGPMMREVPIPPELMQMLDERLGLASAQRDLGQSAMRLWPWSRVTGWRIIKTVMARAGIAGQHACPKAFRHAFGIGTLQANVPINLTQRWLGHASISTTAIYASACGPEERAFASMFWGSGGRSRRASAVANSSRVTATAAHRVIAPPAASRPHAATPA